MSMMSRVFVLLLEGAVEEKQYTQRKARLFLTHHSYHLSCFETCREVVCQVALCGCGGALPKCHW